MTAKLKTEASGIPSGSLTRVAGARGLGPFRKHWQGGGSKVEYLGFQSLTL